MAVVQLPEPSFGSADQPLDEGRVVRLSGPSGHHRLRLPGVVGFSARRLGDRRLHPAYVDDAITGIPYLGARIRDRGLIPAALTTPPPGSAVAPRTTPTADGPRDTRRRANRRRRHAECARAARDGRHP